MITRTVSAAAALLLASAVSAGVPRNLYTIEATGDMRATFDPAVVSVHAVSVDVGVLEAIEPGERFTVPLGGETPATVVVDRVGSLARGHLEVIGHVQGRSASEVVFNVSGGAKPVATGMMTGPVIGSWSIRPAKAGHVLLKLDASRLPPCGGAPTFDAPHAGRVAAMAGAGCEDGARIDVAVYYTPVARVSAGGTEAIEGTILLAVQRANIAYENSEIATRIRLVHLEENGYDESGSYSEHLSRLSNGNDGYMDEAHVLRDEIGADLVALIVNDGEYCGIAYLMPANTPDSEHRGFSVTTWYCAANLVLAHKLGHNMGCCHAPGDGGGCEGGGLYEYSNGYRYIGDSDTEWRTVMAYAPGSRISHFSNPDVTFDGEPTGVPVESSDAAHNARTINETAWAIANYRTPPCTGNVNGDCAVDFTDIVKILRSWGLSDVPADQDGSGTVDFGDIIFVLGYWGPCQYE